MLALATPVAHLLPASHTHTSSQPLLCASLQLLICTKHGARRSRHEGAEGRENAGGKGQREEGNLLFSPTLAWSHSLVASHTVVDLGRLCLGMTWPGAFALSSSHKLGSSLHLEGSFLTFLLLVHSLTCGVPTVHLLCFGIALRLLTFAILCCLGRLAAGGHAQHGSQTRLGRRCVGLALPLVNRFSHHRL